MLARVLTLHFNSMLDGFDDAPLREFIKDKEVISLRDHFFIRNEMPYLTVVVSYRLPPVQASETATQPKGQAQSKRDESWRQWVAEGDVPLFNALRDWRSERCKREGLPPYVICTNRQLAAMIAARPASLAKLGEVEGFGKAKLERYGKDILAILAWTEASTTQQPGTPAAQTDEAAPEQLPAPPPPEGEP